MSDNGQGYVRLFDSAISRVFSDLIRKSLFDPGFGLFLVKALLEQRRASGRRRRASEEGLLVPPLLIASLTDRCNLSCAGCYARARRGSRGPELDAGRWESIFGQARELGVSIVMLAGGEPMLRPEVVSLTDKFPSVIFPIFTNGLLVEERQAEVWRRRRNVFPVISLEGFEDFTDGRRGRGMYQAARRAMEALRGIPWGVSVTVTGGNFEHVTGDEFATEMEEAGARIVFMVEYTPVGHNDRGLAMTAGQRSRLVELEDELSARHRPLFIVFPGDEAKYGGCLAAGRGFFHVGSRGELEPCPFAPFSDTSLANKPLAEALGSELFRAVRNDHNALTESQGGCALWARRGKYQALAGG